MFSEFTAINFQCNFYMYFFQGTIYYLSATKAESWLLSLLVFTTWAAYAYGCTNQGPGGIRVGKLILVSGSVAMTAILSKGHRP